MRRFGQFLHQNARKTGGVFALAATVGLANPFDQHDTNLPNVSLGDWKVDRTATLLVDNGRGEPVRLSRKISSPIDQTNLGLRLYQYQTCPFCSKVRAFLDYYGFSYEVVEAQVHPVTRKQIKFTKQKKVPVLIAHGAHDLQLVDSTFIMSVLRSSMYRPDQTLEQVHAEYPQHTIVDSKSGTEKIEVQNKYFVNFHEILPDKQAIASKKKEREWREWVDGTFVHVISPNVYRTFAESLDTFRWFSEVGDWDINFPRWEQWLAVYGGAIAMFMIAGRLKKRHKLKDDVRESLYDACNAWLEAKGDRPYMGGAKPNLSDIALYGCMQSFHGTTAFIDMRTHTKIGEWYDLMDNAVKHHMGAAELVHGDPRRN